MIFPAIIHGTVGMKALPDFIFIERVELPSVTAATLQFLNVHLSKLPCTSVCVAAVLGAAVFGIGEYARASASLDSDGEMILEMTCMAAVSDFYGEYED